MTYSLNFMLYPGGEHESDNIASKNPDKEAESSKNRDDKKTKKGRKSFVEKIKEALQDWSNKDERDLEYDDTRV